MVLLTATMLLAAGAALILTTSTMTGVAGDATTEVQAYYAAESGMQQVMHILRRNVDSSPAGTEASFRNAADNPTLSNWLTYVNVAGQQMVVVSNNPSSSSAYSVTVTDPDATPAGEEPARLLVRVVGRGPRGAVKQMEMLVNRSPYDLDPPAAITLIGAESGASMAAADFDIGESSPKGYSGDDAAGTGVEKASFAFTVAADQAVAEAKFSSDSKASDSTDDSPSRALLIQQNNLPDWLKTAPAAKTFLGEVAASAQGTMTPGNATQDRYFTSSPAKSDFGSDAEPLLTYVEGDCDFSGDGSGLLVVTGKLTFHGTATFKGVILLLGEGELDRNGGGGGGIYGALIMGRLSAGSNTYLSSPTITTSGGGNSDIKYNSVNVERAFQTFVPTVRDLREY
jgi:hypothetical protein